jgi:hypothetical protein
MDTVLTETLGNDQRNQIARRSALRRPIDVEDESDAVTFLLGNKSGRYNQGHRSLAHQDQGPFKKAGRLERIKMFTRTAMACGILLLGLSTVSAEPCQIDGPRYNLASDIVEWSMVIRRGHSCIGGIRFANVIFQSLKLVSKPQYGKMELQGPGFIYSAKADGEGGTDSFTVAVAGEIKRRAGISMIHVTVTVPGSLSFKPPVHGSTAGVQAPGPSQDLFDHPFYSCIHNFYVAPNGNDGNPGTQAKPWRTIQRADSASRQAGDCINVTPGIYANGANITHGGNFASATGYVVYRCMRMNACRITASHVGFSIVGDNAASYVIIDGFELAGPAAASAQALYGQGIKVWNGGGNNGFAAHHIWLLNNIIHGYGQSGIQMNDGEYYYAYHNTLYNNSLATCDAQGSGISFVALKALENYTPTEDDSTSLSQLIGTVAPFHNVIAWNIVYNTNLSDSRCPGSYHSDGNGIIIDWLSNDGLGSWGFFPYRTLVAFNVTYNNGGAGVHVFHSNNVTVANNTAYNNYLDTDNAGTYRPQIGSNLATDGNEFINNLAYAIPGSGVLSTISAYVGGGGTTLGFSNNIALGVTYVFNGDSYSCSKNKCNTDPLFVNAGITSKGDMDTPPVGANLALQSGSPAIGYGQTRAYLSSQSVDAGACYHALTSCGVINSAGSDATPR